jgi:hypothetical protein
MANMALLGGYYQTKVSAVTLSAGWQKLTKNDPQRYYLRIESYPGAIGNPFVVPNNDLSQLPNPTASNLPREIKWSESVTMCTGEWYVFGTGGETVIVTEVIQLPG